MHALYFEPTVLQRYAHDPRYRFDFDNFGGMVATTDAAFIADDFPEEDKVLHSDVWPWMEGRPATSHSCVSRLPSRPVAPSPRALARFRACRPGQLRTRPRLRADELAGGVARPGLAFEAIFQEQRTLNDIATAMGRPQLFKEVFDVMALPDGLRPFLLPTREEMNRFVFHFDQILSDNINAKFLAATSSSLSSSRSRTSS